MAEEDEGIPEATGVAGTENPIKELLFEDILRFLDAVGAPDKCIVCQHESLGLWESAEGLSSSIVVGEYYQASGRVLALVPVLRVECPNCGFIRLHNRETIDKWLAKNPLKAN